ncbi:hypothetical protein FQN51_007474 [Onygenales sp. PD_10]|nr:hypothetical protein FQN51_007474 [Onygenales sp. PD_10]
MARVQQPTETPPPQFAKPILPYIKSRQETLQIRRALTLYLQAQIDFSDDSPVSHIALYAPHNATNVKRIPPELNNGLRAQYLKALQANIAAKREYHELLQAVASQKRDIQSGDQDPEKKGGELQTYLSLLRSRREHGKMQIFQHYLERLNNMEVGKADYLALAQEQNLSRQTTQNLAVKLSSVSGSSGEREKDVEALLHDLERAVLRAKNQADIEKELVNKLKSQRQGENREALSTSAKLDALRRTHSELVRWVEDKLVVSSSADEGDTAVDQANLGASNADSTQSLEQTKYMIQEQYAAYVDARRALLSAVSVASQPLTTGSQSPQPSTEPREKASNTPTPDLALLFPYVSGHLLPLSKTQKTPSLQKSYLSAILAKERWTTCRMLDRLQEESHLLPEYPILARQPRFKNAVAAINRRSSLLASPTSPNGVSEIVTRAEAWSFAANEARNATNEYIEERINDGNESGRNAEDILKEMYELMNQDYDEATAMDNERADEGDIWALETRLGRNRGRHGRVERRPKGPWSGLNGKVGVGDG